MPRNRLMVADGYETMDGRPRTGRKNPLNAPAYQPDDQTDATNSGGPPRIAEARPMAVWPAR